MNATTRVSRAEIRRSIQRRAPPHHRHPLYIGTTNVTTAMRISRIEQRQFLARAGVRLQPRQVAPGSTAAFYGLLVGSLRWLLSVVSPNGAPPIPGDRRTDLRAVAASATGWILYGTGRNARAALRTRRGPVLHHEPDDVVEPFGGEMPFQIALIIGVVSRISDRRGRSRRALASLAILTRAGRHSGRGRAARL